MRIMKKIITVIGTMLLLATLSTSISFAGKPTGSGGGGKVSVESATPNSVVQSAEEDVIIQGSGFDDGSTVRFLVTGTTDDSQIEVGPAQYISSTELKVHVKTTGSTATVDYDIEVQATSGRKGKGTTLFKVQQATADCLESDPKEPTIAYLTEFDTSGDVNTADIYLSNASGCEQTLLVDDAFQFLPDTRVNEGVNRFIQAVRDPRLAVRGSRGIVIWRDDYKEPWVPMGIAFEFDSNGNIYPDAGGPRQLYFSPEGRGIWEADVHINDLGEAVLAMTEFNSDGSVRLIGVYNIDTANYEVISSGNCQVQDSSGDCFVPHYNSLRWHPSGNEIYFSAENSFTQGDKLVIARIRQLDGEWLSPELVMDVNPPVVERIYPGSVSQLGLMQYRYAGDLFSKRGKRLGSYRSSAIIDLGNCDVVVCDPSDGEVLDHLDGKELDWTGDEGLLFLESGILGEYRDPITAETGNLQIRGVAAFDSGL